jgi:hypothetical protein
MKEIVETRFLLVIDLDKYLIFQYIFLYYYRFVQQSRLAIESIFFLIFPLSYPLSFYQ